MVYLAELRANFKAGYDYIFSSYILKDKCVTELKQFIRMLDENESKNPNEIASTRGKISALNDLIELQNMELDMIMDDYESGITHYK